MRPITSKPSSAPRPKLPWAVTAAGWRWDNVITRAETTGNTSSFTRVQLMVGRRRRVWRAPLSSVHLRTTSACFPPLFFNPTLKQEFAKVLISIFLPTCWSDLTLQPLLVGGSIRCAWVYLNSYQALEHCRQRHQKNPASPSCVLWQRSRPESVRGTSLHQDVNATHVKGVKLPTACISASNHRSVPTHLDAGSLRNRNSPGAVQIVGVRLWVSGRQDGAFAIRQHATTGNWMKREISPDNAQVARLQRTIRRRSQRD